MIDRENPCFYVCAYHGHTDDCAILAGPYATQEEALEKVHTVYRVATKIDKNAWVYEYGTVRLKNGLKNGELNEMLSEMENQNGNNKSKNDVLSRK